MPGELEQRLAELPAELQFNIFEYLPPESLLDLRSNPLLQPTVDGFVESLARRGELVDTLGRPGGELAATDALGDWINGRLGTATFPASEMPLDQQAAIEKYDGSFGTLNAQDWPASMLENVYDPLIAQGGPRGLEIRDELELYARHLVEEGRLIDPETRQPLPPGTTPDAALNALRDGTVIWRAPANV